MPKKKWSILIAVGLAFCALAIVCVVVGLISTNLIPTLFLPVYTIQQTASTHNGYRHTTLSDGNTVYVNDYEEFALLSINTQPPQMIGRFPIPGFGASGIYAIPSQDPSAYALEYDPMYQQVYRNAQHPPIDWRAAEFQKMRLMLPTNPKDTTDPLIIEDVLKALKEGAPIAVVMQANGNYIGYQNYSLLLFSEQLPGLMYSLGVHVDPARQVYFAENAISNQWYPASQVFLEWMNSQ